MMLIDPTLFDNASLGENVGWLANQHQSRLIPVDPALPCNITSSYRNLADTDLTGIPLQFAVAGITFKPSSRRGRPRKSRGCMQSNNRKRGSSILLVEADGEAHESKRQFRQLETWIKQLQPDLVFISEAKCLFRRIDNIRGRFGMFGVSVDARDATVINSGGDDWRFMGFYKHPETVKCKETWELLHKLSGKSVRPWLVAGDFNEILHQKEKNGMNRRPQSQRNDFKRCLDLCNLADIGYNGERFTWCNHREEPYTVRVRLDGAVASRAWAETVLGG
ncbi:UNVERIFIED_CONTAM: hypothetical protein Slati_2984300 [Sesamum latifolium]|uniref:Endonuclease/exonuclease/phosphatase domain-containing protein n=1 Tax=Sesamum latifolium TaxID=2727402 RepID=A0AAW2VFE5_9LAMI